VFLSLCAACCLGQEAPAPALEIGRIDVEGNRTVTVEQVLAKARSRAGEPFNPATAAEDARRIAEIEGVEYCFYNKVEVEGRIHLTFVVVERSIVRAVEFSGNRRVKTKDLKKKLDVRVGDYLDPVVADAGRKNLVDLYRSKGFAFADVAMSADRLSAGELVFAIDEGPRVKIGSVKFTGNDTLKTSALRGSVKAADKSFLILPKDYVEQELERDIAKIEEIYRKKGFLDAGIKAGRLFSADRRSVDIVFDIDEGPRYRLAEIVLEGNSHFSDERLLLELRCRAGGTYNDQAARTDAGRLAALYRENGFVEAGVEHGIRPVSPGEVAAVFRVTENDRFRIGTVDITGNEKTQDRVIRRVLDEYGFKPGNWYDAEIARGDGTGELEKEVRTMVLTESATITAAGETPGRKDARVSVVEGKTGVVMLGAGVGSDSGLIGQFIFEQRNFDIGNRPRSFADLITGNAFRGGGQRLRIALQPGTEVSEYSVTFSEPYYRNKPIELDVVASSWEREREAFDENRLKGYFGFEKRYRNKWRRSIAFRGENVEVDSLDSDAPREIIDVKGDNLLAGVRLGFGRDRTDDIFNPTAGDDFDVTYEQVAGDHGFGLLKGNYRKYKTVREDLAGRKSVLSVGFSGGTVVGDTPPFEMFYAGGAKSIRGFEYRGVSTRGLQTNVANPKRKDPIGSDWLFLANTELAVPVASESLAALFFIDSGAIDSGGYRVSVGTGIQILVPQWFGPVPIRLEIAAPIMKEDEDETQVFSFSVGRLF
jgi:outer membrane protein assembly complex protein YaeT